MAKECKESKETVRDFSVRKKKSTLTFLNITMVLIIFLNFCVDMTKIITSIN